MSSLPIVLVPALTCTPLLYAAQIPVLWKYGPVMIANHMHHSTMAEVAAEVLRNAPPRFALAGLSMGGYVAFEIIRQAPERVARLALMSTSARADTPEQTTNREAQIRLLREGQMERLAAASLDNLLHRREQEGLRRTLLEMSKATGPEAMERELRAIMSRKDSRELLKTIECPTTVIVGKYDRLTPPEIAKEMANGIRGSRYVEIDEAGHALSIEQPEAVNDALEKWLS